MQDTDGLYGLQNIAVKNLSLYGGPLVIGETRSLTFNNIFVSNAAIYNFQDSKLRRDERRGPAHGR